MVLNILLLHISSYFNPTTIYDLSCVVKIEFLSFILETNLFLLLCHSYGSHTLKGSLGPTVVIDFAANYPKTVSVSLAFNNSVYSLSKKLQLAIQISFD